MSPRASRIVSGIAVLLTSITFAHLVHHLFVVHWNDFDLTWRVVGLAIMIPVGVFSFIGAYLLLRGERQSSAASTQMK